MSQAALIIPERRASWLELFFDLAYVAVVAQLTYFLINNPTVMGFFEFIFLLLVAFISWLNPTILKNIHEEEDTLFRFATQLQMLCALTMGVFVGEAFGSGATGFALGYIGVRVIHILLQIRLYRLRPDITPRTWNVLHSYMISVALWSVSVFIPAPFTFVLWGMGLLLDIFGPLTRGKGNKILYLDKNHLPERMGLFTILVMGESVIVLALVNNLSNGTPFTFSTGIIGALGFVMMVAIWWLYFEYEENYVRGQTFSSLPLYIWSHIGLFIGIISLAAGLKLLMQESAGAGLELVLLTGGLLFTLIGFSVLKYATTQSKIQVYVPTFIFGILLISFAATDILTPIGYVGVLALSLVAYVISENITCFGLTYKKVKAFVRSGGALQ